MSFEIEVETNFAFNEEIVSELQQHGFTRMTKRSVFGTDQLAILVGTITTASIASITKILVEIIRSRSNLEIRIGDESYKGITEKQLMKILDRFFDDD